MDEEELEREQKKEERKAKQQQSTASHAQLIRTAAVIAEKVPHPVVAAVGKAVLIADKVTGGLSTKALGYITSKTQPKLPKYIVDKLGESGMLDAAATVASAAGGGKNNTSSKAQPKGKNNQAAKKAKPKKKPQNNKSTPPPKKAAGNAKTGPQNNKAGKKTGSGGGAGGTQTNKEKPTSTIKEVGEESKLGSTIAVIVVLILAITIIPLLVILLILFLPAIVPIVISPNLLVNTFEYGNSCVTITVTDTDCDENGRNCTKIYDETVSLEDYVAGVVAAEVGDTNNKELYKATAISARTYVSSNTMNNCTIPGNKTTQDYMDVDKSPNANIIKNSVEETKGMVLIEEESLSKVETGKIDKNEAINLINNQNYTYDQILKHYYGENKEIKQNNVQLSGIGDFVNPTRRIHCSSPFGYRIHPVKKTKKMHTGIDIAIPGGEPVFAASSGTISKVVKSVKSINNCNYGYGNYIIIDHGNGMSTLYGHLKYGSIPDNITTGMFVTQGAQIGKVGSTGCSTGNHLHYEVRENGNRVNPADYMDLTGSTGTCKR